MLHPSKRITITLFVFGCFLLLYYIGALKPLYKLPFFILSEIQGKVVREGSRLNQVIKQTGTSKSELAEEVAKLRQERNNLIVQTASLPRLKRENETLRKILSFQKEESRALVMADVIGKNNSVLEKSLTVNRGSFNGIGVGNPVVIDEGTLVGAIVSVTPNTAKITLTTDDDSIVLATIVGIDHAIAGAVQGSPEARLQLNLVPKTIELAPQQKVVTNGLQEGMPEGLYIGEITAIEQDENKIFNAALIDAPYFLEDLTVVGIVVAKEL